MEKNSILGFIAFIIESVLILSFLIPIFIMLSIIDGIEQIFKKPMKKNKKKKNLTPAEVQPKNGVCSD